jgi:peptidoglycan hydrolase-like protein with peptidoglycan-binding domain
MNEPRSATTAVPPAPDSRGGVTASTGGTTTVTAATRLFHVRFKFRNPLTDALVNFPASLQALLFNGAIPVGAPLTLNAEGYCALPFPPPVPARPGHAARALPNYGFTVRCPVRAYINLAAGTLVRADALGPTDTRNLFELPLEMNTEHNNFLNDPITGFTNGRFNNYAGTGEGTESAPLIFTLNLHWYPIQFKFYDIILRRMTEVPRGMSVQARIHNKTYPEAMEDLSFVGAFAAMTTSRGRQQRLKWLGFFTGEVDGLESAALTAALQAFQAGHGLTQSGLADAPTLAMLTEAFYNRRVAVMRDNTYLVPVLAKTPIHLATQIHFLVKQENLWVNTPTHTSTPVVQQVLTTDVNALTYPDKFKYYDLPSYWTSEGAYFRRGNDLENPVKWSALRTSLACYPTGTTAIPQTNPLVVNLDDMILLSNATHLETVVAGNRYSVFDLMGDIIEPDDDEPYLSRSRNNDGNYFACQDGGAFTVYFEGHYYFANRKRVPANLRRAGLRAAIKNDQVNRAISEPVVLAAGHLEENFFFGVDFRNDKIISYVIAMWTCKLIRDSSVHTSEDRAIVSQGILDYKLNGMVNCKLRHEENDFDVVDNLGVSPHFIKVLKHFVVWDSSHAKCVVHVHNGTGRDNMGIDVAHFNAANWEAEFGGWASTEGSFVAAHELGHAMGLDDDYLEPPGSWGDPAWDSPLIPRFAQWVKGNPFAGDSSSLMNSNEKFRHRMLFHHVNWLNSNADILTLTGNRRFKVQTPDHDYYLPPPADRNFLTTATRHIHYMPVVNQVAFVNGTHGKMDLLLYKIGRDQTPREIVAGQDFDGILTVCLYIKWAFHTVGGVNWTPTQKMDWIKQNYTILTNLVNQKKYLGTTAAASAHFQKIYLLFRLHFHEGGDGDDNAVLLGSGHIHAHFTVTVYRTHTGTAAHIPNYHTDGFHNSVFSIDQGSAPTPWLRYMLGMAPATFTPGMHMGTTPGVPIVHETNTISNVDLAFLSAWANTNLGAAGLGSGYTVQDF